MKLSGFLVIISLFLAGYRWRPSCTCVGSNSIKAYLKAAKTVFVGRVVSTAERLDTVFILGKDVETRSQRITTFEIEEWIKNRRRKKTVLVEAGTGPDDCGIPFSIGERFIVFGHRPARYTTPSISKPGSLKEDYSTSTCYGTEPYSDSLYNQIKQAQRAH